MQTATAPAPIKVDELVRRFIQVRDKKSQLKAEYEQAASKLTELQDKIEALLLHRFSEMGVDSMKTPHGTAYTSRSVSATVGDWDAFIGFVKANGAYELLEHRVSKTAAEQYRVAHNELPPGVNWSESRTINFRRS